MDINIDIDIDIVIDSDSDCDSESVIVIVSVINIAVDYNMTLTGLILVISLTEPVGLAPHYLTEPDRETMSPLRMLCQILSSNQSRFLITATGLMM